MNNNILLTGANGFFGCHLIWELQQRGNYHLRCLVRAEQQKTAEQRLQSALCTYQLDAQFESIQVIPADLAEPDFGLGKQAFEQLATGIDTIVHAGACVNFSASEQQMIRTNIEGTKRLLERAQAASVKRFVQISSLAVVNGLPWPEGNSVPEDRITLQGVATASSYPRSKLGSETTCLEAASDALEVSVLRLPYLLASRSGLGINRHGYFDVVLRAALLLQSSFDEMFSLHALPVDLCADWVTSIILATALPPVINVLHQRSLFWSEWLEAAEAMGAPIRQLPMEAWYQRLRNAAAKSHDHDLLEAIAFLRLEATHKRWMHMNAHRLQFENSRLCALVPAAAEPLEFPTTYKQAIMRALINKQTTHQ